MSILLPEELVLPEDAPHWPDAPAPVILCECGTVDEATAAEVLIVSYGGALYRYDRCERVGTYDEATGRWLPRERTQA